MVSDQQNLPADLRGANTDDDIATRQTEVMGLNQPPDIRF